MFYIGKQTHTENGAFFVWKLVLFGTAKLHLVVFAKTQLEFDNNMQLGQYLKYLSGLISITTMLQSRIICLYADDFDCISVTISLKQKA